MDFEPRYLKMLKGARVASNGFLIRTSESTDFNKKTLSIRQVQVHLLFYWTIVLKVLHTTAPVVRFGRTAVPQNCRLDIQFKQHLFTAN